VSTRLTLIVLLFVRPDRRIEFEQFEASAGQIMKRYGGAIERRIALSVQTDPSQPQEVHIVTFPDRESFERYRSAPELEALASLRSRGIRETIVWSGFELPTGL
jgi:hypothetical protein